VVGAIFWQFVFLLVSVQNIRADRALTPDSSYRDKELALLWQFASESLWSVQFIIYLLVNMHDPTYEARAFLFCEPLPARAPSSKPFSSSTRFARAR
jgi:hypothetical protein